MENVKNHINLYTALSKCRREIFFYKWHQANIFEDDKRTYCQCVSLHKRQLKYDVKNAKENEGSTGTCCLFLLYTK